MESLRLPLVVWMVLEVSLVAALTHPMEHLEKRAPLPTGENLTAIVHTGAMTVIATSEPKLVITADLENFETIPTGLPSGFNALINTVDGWFGAGDHLYRSADLSSWESLLAPDNSKAVFSSVGDGSGSQCGCADGARLGSGGRRPNGGYLARWCGMVEQAVV